MTTRRATKKEPTVYQDANSPESVREINAMTAEYNSRTTRDDINAKGRRHDEVAKLAYAIWQESGGNAEDNWHEAERRLR